MHIPLEQSQESYINDTAITLFVKEVRQFSALQITVL